VPIETTPEFRKTLTEAKQLITDKLIEKQQKEMDTFKKECKKEMTIEVEQKMRLLEDKIIATEQEVKNKQEEIEKMTEEIKKMQRDNEELLEENKQMMEEKEDREEKLRGKISLNYQADPELKKSLGYRLEKCKEIYESAMGSSASFGKDVSLLCSRDLKTILNIIILSLMLPEMP
jgi:TolA-binding protein